MIKLPPLDPYAGATADRNNTNFPIRANGLTYVDTEADVLYVYASGAWHGLGAPGIPEPDDDGETYGRMTDTGVSSWVTVVPSTGGTFSGAVTVNGSFVVNDTAADVDGRIEGTSDPNLTYWDAGNNRVGFGTPTPATKVDVNGGISLRVANITLGNGDNDNIAIGDASWVRATGPTASFNISGFAGGANGRVMFLAAAVSQSMTIENNSGKSSAGNRIFTTTGANVTLGNAGKAVFIYDSGSSVWRMFMGNGSAGPV